MSRRKSAKDSRVAGTSGSENAAAAGMVSPSNNIVAVSVRPAVSVGRGSNPGGLGPGGSRSIHVCVRFRHASLHNS